MNDGGIERALGRLEGKCDAILQRLDEGKERMDVSDTRHGRTERRVSKLENWRWFVLGGFAAVMAVAKWVLA